MQSKNSFCEVFPEEIHILKLRECLFIFKMREVWARLILIFLL